MLESAKSTSPLGEISPQSNFGLTLLGLPGKIRDRFFPSEDELGPVKMQHLDLFRHSVEKYQRFYDLPDEITNKANSVDIHFVTYRQLNFFLENELRRNFRAWLLERPSSPETRFIERNFQYQIDKVVMDSTKIGGLTKQSGDRVKILITQNTTMASEEKVDHEALHTLSYRNSSKDSGFLTAGENWGLRRKPYVGKSINEAMTEVLRLAEAYSSLGISGLYEAIHQGQIQLAYHDCVPLLLQLIVSAERHIGKSFDIGERAPLYFGFNNMSSAQARTQFITSLETNLPSDEKSILDYFTRN